MIYHFRTDEALDKDGPDKLYIALDRTVAEQLLPILRYYVTQWKEDDYAEYRVMVRGLVRTQTEEDEAVYDAWVREQNKPFRDALERIFDAA